MPIDFPSVGLVANTTTYTYSGRTWKWDGSGWQIFSPNISFTDVTTALGYTPLSANGGTISGTLQVTGTINTTSSFTSDSINTVSFTSNTINVTHTANTANLVSVNANVTGNVVVGNRITANVVSGAIENSTVGPIVTVATVAGAITSPSITTAASGTLALTANRQYFVPVYIPKVITTTNLACEVTTAGASSSIRLNIYAADANGAPTGSPLAADVLVSSATTGVKTGAWVATLEPGLYWASMVCNATAPTIRTLTAPGTIGISTLGATSIYSYIYGTFTFAAMGAYTGVTSITGVAPATATPLIAIY